MKFAPFLVALLAAQPGAAFACSLMPDPRPADVRADEEARRAYTGAESMVEVVALQSSQFNRPGLVRVVRVLKGPLKRGRLLRLRSFPSSMCGAGDFERGARGLILIGPLKGPLFFQGFLSADFLQRLDRLGLRPIETPPLSAHDR